MNDTKLVIVTGLSGAGMSSALKHFEDMGYEALDNFPLALIESLIASKEDTRPIALGIDTRTRGFDVQALLDKIEELNAKLLFLHADEAVLQKRFTETRRRHPLAKDRPVSAGIKKEMSWLFPLRGAATMAIDTSELSIHDLRRQIEGQFKIEQAGTLTITLLSFGYKYGLPREADIVMDARFLRNPHWVANLRPLTGKDPKVGDYIAEDPAFNDFINSFKSLLSPLLPRYQSEGKSYLTIAVGCSGGRHRSTHVVETLAKVLENQGVKVHIEHRDIDR